jgi:hypothetical protein
MAWKTLFFFISADPSNNNAAIPTIQQHQQPCKMQQQSGVLPK